MTFLEFMDYTLVLIEGTLREKANFLFRFISMNKLVFAFGDLVQFYKLINATDDKLGYHSILFDEKEPHEDLMGKLTWAVLGKDMTVATTNQRSPFQSSDIPDSELRRPRIINTPLNSNFARKSEEFLSPEHSLNSPMKTKTQKVQFKYSDVEDLHLNGTTQTENREDANDVYMTRDNLNKTETIARSPFYVTVDEFESFILANPSHVELFNFVQGTSKTMLRSFRIQKTYADFMRKIQNIEEDVRTLQLVVFRGDQNFLLPRATRFYAKYNATILKMFFGNDSAIESANASPYLRRTLTDRNFLTQAFGSIRNAYVQDLTLLRRMTAVSDKDTHPKNYESVREVEEILNRINFEAIEEKNDISSILDIDSEKEVLYPNETTKPFDKKVDLKNLEMNLFKKVIQKLEKIKMKMNNQMEQLLTTSNFSKLYLHANSKKYVNSDKTKKVVFVNNKNWNIVTSMVNGIYKSVNINANDKYHILSKLDFKFHNKLEMESVFSTAFNRCKFKDYAPHVFQNIRSMFGISNEDYIRSIGVDTFRNTFFDKLILMLSENSSGKSGSFFFHTSDGKYMIKTIKPSEFNSLRMQLPFYYQHIQENPKTLLTRYFGLHEIKCYNDTKLIYDIYIVVMNNVFDLDDPTAIVDKYDLKGSLYGRKSTPEEIKVGHAKKDNNLIESAQKLITLDPEIKQIVCRQISLDAKFLAESNIIDYSLLLGFVPAEKDSNDNPMFDKAAMALKRTGKCGSFIESKSGKWHFYIGIIDALTPFNAFKRSEYLVKRIFQGRGISCVPPHNYKERFVEFMQTQVFLHE
jgi:hypothetical protein